jgi:hypothetical protein
MTRRRNDKRLANIWIACAAGAKSSREVSDMAGINTSLIGYYTKKYNLPLTIPQRQPKSQTMELVRQACDGTDSEQEAAENLLKAAIENGYSPSTFLTYAAQERLVSSRIARPCKRKPDADALIQRGATQEEIGRTVSKKAECRRPSQIGWLYIQGTGQHSFWKEAKAKSKAQIAARKESEKQALREVQSELVSTISAVARIKAAQKGWAYEKTVEYLQSYKIISIKDYSFDTLLKIFSRYKASQNNGKALTLEELSEGTDVAFVQIGKILKRTGLGPLASPNRKPVVKPTQQQIDEINRSFATSLNSPDLAYFIGVPWWVAYQRLSKLGKRDRVKMQIIGTRKAEERITYRDASLIYEFQDDGYNVAELSDLMEKSSEVIERAIAVRPKIEKEIIEALRIIKQAPKLNKPYLRRR